jgi:hypothetical protein
LLRKPAIWSGLALLTLGSAYWFVAQPARQPASVEAKPIPAQQASTTSTGAATPKEAPADSLADNIRMPASPTIPATPSAATIREETQKTSISDQKTAQSAATEKPTRTSLADAKYPQQPQSPPNKPPRTSTQMTEQAKRKPSTTQTVAKNKNPPGVNEKKSSERDIDIITAIVR